jgi:transposase
MREIPVKSAGQILGESDSRLRQIHLAYVKVVHARLRFDNVVWVGADPMNRRKGLDYLTVFADLMVKWLLFAAPGMDASVWEAFAAKSLRHKGHPKTNRHVPIDMSSAYTKGVSDPFRNVRVVYEKLYVIQNVMEACDEARKAEIRADAAKQNLLDRTRWIRLKNLVNWTEKEAPKWKSMPLERCVTGKAYEMSLALQGIHGWQDSGGAWKLFGNWCAWVQAIWEQTAELLEPIARAARMIEGYLEAILAHRNRGLTTGVIEGLNSLFTALQRKARGYRTVEYMTTML